MIDFDGLIDTTRTFTVKTSQGLAVVKFRPLDRSNDAFINDMLAREQARSATDASAETGPASAEARRAVRLADAADLHRWCYESLSIGDTACTAEEGLAFLRMLAGKVPDVFERIGPLLMSKGKGASSDAIAGE